MLQRFVAFLDFASGMTEDALERWACIRSAPGVAYGEQISHDIWTHCRAVGFSTFCVFTVSPTTGETPYYADAILNKFGEGSKVVFELLLAMDKLHLHCIWRHMQPSVWAPAARSASLVFKN